MQLNHRIRARLAIASIAITALTAGAAAAQDAPPASPTVKPITLIVPFSAGGPSDALARALAQAMSVHLKQSIVVENITGAGGTIGLARLVNSPADGTTLAFGTVGTHVANVAVYKKLPYDPLADFEPVGLAGTAPTMLVARTSLPVSNLQDFVAYAQNNRGKMTYGSAGVGSISHFACVILLSAVKQTVTHVPYRGVAPAMNDLMGQHIDFMCDQSTSALPQIAGGKIKPVAILTDEKLPQLPDVATAASAGYADVNVRAWNALFAPRGTPPHVIKALNDALRAAVSDTALATQMRAVGVDLPSADNLAPAVVSTLIRRGIERDVPALKARGEYLD